MAFNQEYFDINPKDITKLAYILKNKFKKTPYIDLMDYNNNKKIKL